MYYFFIITPYCNITGDITAGDVALVLPYGNTVDYMELQGRYVRDMLEAGVAEYVKYEEGVDLPSSLLQTSGISYI